MTRAACTLFLIGVCAPALAFAQREAPPAPEEPPAAAAAPSPSTSGPPAEATAPAEPATPPAPADTPPAPPETPPPPPPSEQPPSPPPAAPRYEGQVSGDENTPTYDEDLGQDDEKRSDAPNPRTKFPGISIRLDPFNWLIDGRLGLELEVVAWQFISVEAVPIFIANDTPPAFNFQGREDAVSQHSHGLGPIAGTSIGAGFWLSGKPLEGYVVRAILTNYGLTYKASDGSGVFDRVNHTERHLIAYIGSHSRFGLFTIAGGIGLGYELNQQQRCFANRGTAQVMAATSGCRNSGVLDILLDREGVGVADLNGAFHPFYIIGRFSVGVTFD